ncbi:MAG: UDP-2,3-diacylglucosamine diphosphatase [Planctomycetota bacterium]
MRTLFMADMHLLPGEHPQQEAALRGLLAETVVPGDRVVLLGDVFHFWYERGLEHLGEYDSCLRVLREAVKSGIRMEMIWGNRDFTAGPCLTHLTGIQVLGDHDLLELGGERVLAIHGDAFCTLDCGYQAMRWCFTGPIGRLAHRLMPFWLIGPVVRRVQARSPRIRNEAPGPEADLQDGPIVDALRRHQAQVCVCGHIHCARDRCLPLDGGRGRLIVVAPWGETGEALLHDGEKFCPVKALSPLVGTDREQGHNDNESA